jgi:cyclopropane fatty-acyl-phospholipid synthase-like methyltransferase
VGCSLGNIAKAFLRFPEISYTGVDIDPIVIGYAQKEFAAFPQFRFIAQAFQDYAESCQELFDYILFSGIFHHINDEICLEMLQTVQRLMPKEGTLVVVDPVAPEEEDSWLIHWFLKLEQGKYVRRETDLKQLLCNSLGLCLKKEELHFVGATPLSFPRCARFAVYLISKTGR